MQDTANNVLDARLSEALGSYFNGITLRRTVGDCAILSGVRKQNGAPVSIYTPSFSVARDDSVVAEIGKAFAIYDRIGSPRLQATERLLATRAFRKSPALAVLACPVPVFDEAIDTMSVEARLQIFDQVLEGLAALHGAGLVHGNLSPDVVRREAEGGALRLTDLTFSGDRSTTVTSQPPAYQSRHVLATTQPRPEDDVHAAGMLGYRLLLGADGPARALTGDAADPDAIVAAVLGEDRPAPAADVLFPEGHPKADQIARLLARMTGRLPNAQPYSGAEAARRAFQTVLSGREAPDPGPGHVAMPDASPRAAIHAQRPGGVSKATALTLFAGFLVSTAAACYFFVGHSDAISDRNLLARTLDRETNRFEAATEAHARLRAADRALATALASGVLSASAASEAAAERATALLEEADATLSSDPSAAGDVALQAEAEAEAALSALAEARSAAKTAVDAASVAAVAAGTAVGDGHDTLASLFDTQSAAREALIEGRFESALLSASDAVSGFEVLTSEARARSLAREAAYGEANSAGGGAEAILAGAYATRAASAFDAGRFAQATALYDAAIAALAPTDGAASESGARTVSLGDSPDALEAALALCRSAAPIDPGSCPDRRPEGEAAREAEITPYELDTTEVSNADFRAFVDATGHVTEAESSGRVLAVTSSGEARLIDGSYAWSAPRGEGSSADPVAPAVVISLSDARAYCDWTGGRLPTEAEWEAAARGAPDAVFPFGDWAPDAPVWRGAPSPDRRLTVAVKDAAGVSDAGHYGMAGNAREWVMGKDGAVLKGGSWNTVNPADLRISARLVAPGNAAGVDFGFRCARDLEAWP